MGGIAGIIDRLQAERTVSLKEQLFHMLQAITHRGDEQAAGEMHICPTAALGCNRLLVTDGDKVPQPVTDEGERLAAVLDGRIFNYSALRQSLEGCGYVFRTEAEAELLLYGYREWGEDLPQRLEGMFAFLIYDREQHTFLAARDHIGIKPLYYVYDGACYFISSELKSLLPLKKNITTLSPGHYLTDHGVQQYFHLSASKVSEDVEVVKVSLREALTHAIERQLPSDQPFGVLFSGGIDSAIILHVARAKNREVVAFSTGFAGAADVEIARQYCREHNITHFVSQLTLEEMVQDLPQTVYYCEVFEPINIMDSCTVMPTFRLARAQGIKVVLCGDGSDELLAGYDLFQTYPDPQYLMDYRLNNEHRTDLQRIDRCSARYGIEARVPFFDKAFMEFAYSIPFDMKLRNTVHKWILREAFRDILPDYIVHRPKVRMPDGSGLQYQLLDFASKQQTNVDPSILAQLFMSPTDGAYFLEHYLKHGFPVPVDRYKKAGLDFSPHGYFDFITAVRQEHASEL
uniref:asparagine synthase (glutamine-hydrolyzing) n=1 Tax=Thermosporothrix sp. COM3 TaxID=2490863 RepID=A0A455SI55_9CHLR|nr:asparagine synthetase B [Thermosporothrix sp. COM3]